MVGVILGTVLLNFRISEHGQALIDMVDKYHKMIESFEIGMGVYLRMLIYRLGMGIILFYVIHRGHRYEILIIGVCISGVSFGYTLSLLSFCYGFKGIMCTLAYLFPHGFFYIPLILAALKETHTLTKQEFYTDFRTIGANFLVLCLGCGAEIYINPIVLKIILKNFF